MAYGKDPKVEVESLAKRFPKRGIDPTIPEGVREQLMDMRRQRELDEGAKAHEGRKLANGGVAKGVNMKKSNRYAMGGMTEQSPRMMEAPPQPKRMMEAPPPREAPVDIPLIDASDPRYGGNYTRSGRIDRQYAKGGGVKGYASGGKTGGASSRADGCAQRGHTKGKMR